MRFLFNCGNLTEQLDTITLQSDEISEYRFEDPAQATDLLGGPVRRRVSAALAAEGFIYLEDGQPVGAVRSS